MTKENGRGNDIVAPTVAPWKYNHETKKRGELSSPLQFVKR